MTDDELLLVLDVGTSSVRAALYNARGELSEDTFVKHSRTLHTTIEGGAEIDAEEALAQVVAATDEVLARAGDRVDKIRYACASSFWHSLVGVDAAGNALTPVYGWADTRSARYVKDLTAQFDTAETHTRTGCRFHSSYWTAKLLYIRREKPEIFGAVDKWLSFSDFVAARFFNQAVTSVSMASGTGLLDVHQCVWDKQLIEFLGVANDQLPRIADAGESFQLGGFYGERWTGLKDVRWFLAIGDGAANNVGAGCMTADEAALMIGTSGAMRVLYTGEPPAELPSGLWCYRLDHNRVLVGGALSDGGGLYQWMKNSFHLEKADDELEDEIARMTPDAHCLTILPFWAGERSTNWNAAAHGAILGLMTHTQPIDVLQAVLESVAYRFAAILEQLQRVCDVREVIASGGALRESPVWTGIIADALGVPLTLPDTPEASSRGAVLAALETIGKIENIARLPTPEGQTFPPDSSKFAVYQRARQRQEHYYRLLFERGEA